MKYRIIKRVNPQLFYFTQSSPYYYTIQYRFLGMWFEMESTYHTVEDARKVVALDVLAGRPWYRPNVVEVINTRNKMTDINLKQKG